MYSLSQYGYMGLPHLGTQIGHVLYVYIHVALLCVFLMRMCNKGQLVRGLACPRCSASHYVIHCMQSCLTDAIHI